MKMYLGIVNKAEITTDKATVNMFLVRGRVLLEVVATAKKEFSFLPASYDEDRFTGNGLLKSK